jgi:hypothetical protein
MTRYASLFPLLVLAAPACGAVAADHTHDAAADAPLLRHDAGATRDGTARDGRSADAGRPRDASPDGGFTGCDSGQPGVQCIAVHGGDLLAVDDENVYFAQTHPPDAAPAVMRVARSGGAPVTLAESFAHALTTDGSYLYWVEYAHHGEAGAQTVIVRVPVGGGSLSTLVPVAQESNPACLAVDDASLYWTDNAIATDAGLQAGVLKVPKDGGPRVVVAAEYPYVVGALTLDSTSIYWLAARSVQYVGKDGGSVTTLVSNADAGFYASSYCHALARVQSVLYLPFIDLAGGENDLLAVSVADAAASVLAPHSKPAVLVADSRAVYWAGYVEHGIYETPLDGGPTVTLASPGPVHDIVQASDGTLYWMTDTQVQAMKPPQ